MQSRNESYGAHKVKSIDATYSRYMLAKLFMWSKQKKKALNASIWNSPVFGWNINNINMYINYYAAEI